MEIVTFDEREFEPYAKQRKGTIEYKPLFRGSSGDPDNFEFTVIRWGEGGSYSPRHHHNFEQFRLPLEGNMNYSPKLDVEQGQLGYFSEGGYYGPQEIEEGTVSLLVQFAGPNGHGFMDYPETKRGAEELSQRGEFHDGIYTWLDEKDGRTHNKDGYEAVWEHVNRRPVEYVVPRFREPVVVNLDAFEWVDVDDAPGVAVRSFGVFNERGTAARQYRLQEGSEYVLSSDGRTRLFFVLSGNARVEGAEAPTYSAIRVDRHEDVSVVGLEDETTLINFDMPLFAEAASV